MFSMTVPFHGFSNHHSFEVGTLVVPGPGKPRHCLGKILVNCSYCLWKLVAAPPHILPRSSETANGWNCLFDKPEHVDLQYNQEPSWQHKVNCLLLGYILVKCMSHFLGLHYALEQALQRNTVWLSHYARMSITLE